MRRESGTTPKPLWPLGDTMPFVRVVVLGAGGVGKSALIRRFSQGSWLAKYDPTVEDAYNVCMAVGGQSVSVQILDTAGQEEFRELRDEALKRGDAFMLVFSLTDDESFEDIARLRKAVLGANDRAVPMILVATKADLEDDQAVGRQEAQRFATDGKMEYAEVSAKTDKGIREVCSSEGARGCRSPPPSRRAHSTDTQAFEALVGKALAMGTVSARPSQARTVMGAGRKFQRCGAGSHDVRFGTISDLAPSHSGATFFRNDSSLEMVRTSTSSTKMAHCCTIS
eukprot:scaffold1390_cov249-Pinguiococcus_pyrenoidosus.AAC.26